MKEVDVTMRKARMKEVVTELDGGKGGGREWVGGRCDYRRGYLHLN